MKHSLWAKQAPLQMKVRTTNTHAGARHMGNRTFIETEPGSAKMVADYGANLTTLDGIIDTSNYLAPTSDIVALMVLEW